MLLVKNKKAKRDYDINKTYSAGIVLSGAEVKSIRLKHASLKGSYVKHMDGELFLINAQVNPYSFADNSKYDPKRTRKLLMKKKEIYQLVTALDKKNWSLIPLSLELKHNKIKVMVGLGKGRKEYEKREMIKKRDVKRNIDRMMKNNYG